MLHKMILVTSLLLGSILSTAADDEKRTAEFQNRKTEILKEADEHIAKAQEHRNCVSAASDPEAMRKCREARHAYRKEERSEHLERRENRMEENLGKLRERKQKRDQR